MSQETRSAQILIRIQPSLKLMAERAAKDDTRSLSSLIEKLLTDHLRANGYLNPDGSPPASPPRAPRAE